MKNTRNQQKQCGGCMSNQLVQKLIEVQQIMGEIDQDFAGQLGSTRSSWSLIRSGKRNLGLKVLGLGHITLSFTALERYILAYLRELVQTHKSNKTYKGPTNPTNRLTNSQTIMTRLLQETHQSKNGQEAYV